ncbi:MAG: acyl-CoA dehydrogenase [Xanthomonadales bacterium]|nr:acyl-CoA dehydrogenase [Xanthomonadales bacterium]
MALILNEEQQMLQDAARGFLRDRAPIEHLRSLRDRDIEDRVSLDLWAEMAEMGWPAILVPEAHGGLGYGYCGLGIVLEESGRTLTPSPLLSTALTGVTAVTAGGSDTQCADILPRVAAGEVLLALACDEAPRHAPDRVETRAEPMDGGFRLTGKKTGVHDGHSANLLIVSAATPDGLSLFLVPADTPGVNIERYPVLDIAAAANVHFDNVQLPADSVLGHIGNATPVLEHTLDAARVGVSAELLGIAQEAFERTMEYIKQRKQFGVLVGGFQALQHRAAMLYADIELCKSLVLRALQVLDETAGGDPELSSATKAKLCATAHHAANEAIQMHGGIGMTDEFDIGFFLKRCQILEALYGDRHFHYDRYARLRGY